jgi:hypothetical protein
MLVSSAMAVMSILPFTVMPSAWKLASALATAELVPPPWALASTVTCPLTLMLPEWASNSRLALASASPAGADHVRIGFDVDIAVYGDALAGSWPALRLRNGARLGWSVDAR